MTNPVCWSHSLPLILFHTPIPLRALCGGGGGGGGVLVFFLKTSAWENAMLSPCSWQQSSPSSCSWRPCQGVGFNIWMFRKRKTKWFHKSGSSQLFAFTNGQHWVDFWSFGCVYEYMWVLGWGRSRWQPQAMLLGMPTIFFETVSLISLEPHQLG